MLQTGKKTGLGLFYTFDKMLGIVILTLFSLLEVVN